MLHGHGDDWYKYQQPVLFNFSSNVWHEGTPPALLNAMRQSLTSIGRYPSPDAGELSEMAANYNGLPSDFCLFTNGATEAFYLIAQLFRNQTATIFSPTFAEYEDACLIHGIKTKFLNQSDFPSTTIVSKLVFLCNPNNPDGRITSLKILARQINQNPSTVFVIDEAYIDFSGSAESCVSLIQKYPNLIVVKSLTKLFCIPGIRLGYLLSSPALLQQLKENKMPWSVNSMAIAAGLHIFRHFEELHPKMDKALKESQELQNKISQIEGFTVIPADTTFFLIKFKKSTAAALKNFLMQQYQLLVRDATNFRSLEGEWIRVATQSPEGNQLLLKGLQEWTRMQKS